MKRKEIKEFEKQFKKSTDEGKQNLISELFEAWTKQFEKMANRSPKEVVGFVQQLNTKENRCNDPN